MSECASTWTRVLARTGRAAVLALALGGLALGPAPPAAAGTVAVMSAADPAAIGDSAGGDLDRGRVSGDGRYAVFTSPATNLVAGQVDANGDDDVFLRDRVAGTTVLVSHVQGASATAGNESSNSPVISADGAWVAFASYATDLVASQVDSQGTEDVFLYEVATGTVRLVSHVAGAAATAGNGSSNQPSISADGAWVAFACRATDLLAGLSDPNGGNPDVYLFGRSSGALTLVSHPPGAPTTTGDSYSESPAISADGGWVAFTSAASNLVAGQVDNSGYSDLFVYGRAGGTMALASHTPGAPATTGNGDSRNAVISGDGAWVGFVTNADDLVSGGGDTNGGEDLYLWGRASGVATLVSHAAGSATTTANAGASDLTLSSDGSWLAFRSGATNLVSGQADTNDADDVFLLSRATGVASLVSHLPGAAASAGNANCGAPALSADGAWVAFASEATDLVSGQVGAAINVFVAERATGAVSLVSHTPGAPTNGGNAWSEDPVLSGDGSWVAFDSDASDLVSGVLDRNRATDVFLAQRSSGAVSLVSARDAAMPCLTGDGPSWVPDEVLVPAAVSADGAWAVLLSGATNLVPGQVDGNVDYDGDPGDDVFLLERATGALTLVSHTPGGLATAGDGPCLDPVISADGDWVAFASSATDLVAGSSDGNGANDVFLYERATGEVTLVSHAASSLLLTGDDYAEVPVISADGAWVAFASAAQDLVAGQADTNSDSDVFLWERATGTARLVSHAAGAAATAGDSYSWVGSISADGRRVAFESYSTDLVSGQVDGNSGNDVFLFDRASGAVALVSHVPASAVTTGDSYSGDAAVSADGAWVAFVGGASNLVAGQLDANADDDVFLWERATGTVRLVSHSAAGATTAGNSYSFGLAISADGGRVAFESYATDLVGGSTDANGSTDVFLYERSGGAVTLVSHASSSALVAGNSYSERVGLSADGDRVVFQSSASDLVGGATDANESSDVFLYRPASGASLLLSHPPGSPTSAANSYSWAPVISADGLHVAFTSQASDLAAGDHNLADDAFLWSSPAIVVEPTSGLVTTEAGGSDQLTVVLDAEPAANVVVGLSSSDASEGTVSPSSLTFTPGDWDVPRTVTVTGVDDAVNDGTARYAVVTAPATSADPELDGVDPADATVENLDNEAGTLFEDGFETGSTSAWSNTVP